jgi:DNA-binding winged helix-turn-helix (wHTH) protein
VDIRFGECEFDLERRQVFRAGREAHLSRKAFDLLGLLIAMRPRVVFKGELQTRLWPSTFVVEGNLSNLVAEVRRALGDDPHRPRYVRTVHGLGYAFCGVESGDERPTTLPPVVGWLVFGGGRLPLTRGEHLIGRSPTCAFPIDDTTVSRRHARIVVGDDVTLVDLGSRNGTYLRGARVVVPSTLRDGDRVVIGSLTMTVLMPDRCRPKDPSPPSPPDDAVAPTDSYRAASPEASPAEDY